MTTVPETAYAIKRSSRRAKLVRPVRVRPSEPRNAHFEDLPTSINVSQKGIFFSTRRDSYYVGMRVFVTFPFSHIHDPLACEYIAEVVRVESFPNKRYGVAVHLQMTVNISH